MSDLISRQAAIDAFERFIHELGIKDAPYNYGEMALSVQNVPPVEPERQSGKVVFKHRHHHNVNHYTGEDADGEIHKISVLEDYEVDEPYCSECGKRIDDIQGRFCVHCGVRFEEEV